MRCILCGRENTGVFRVVDNYKITKCLNDGLLYVDPQPSISEHKNFYNIDYFEREKRASVDQGYRDYLSEKGTFKKNFFRILHKIEKVKSTKGRILDIGCAFGFFVECARLNGWEASGVELNETVAQWARDRLRVNVFNGTVASCNFPGSYFDVVCLIGVIEHLLNPLEELREVFRILKRDGLVCVITGDIDKVTRRWIIKPPEHLYYFSQLTLEKLLMKAGFSIYVYENYFKFFSICDVASKLFQSNYKLFNNQKLAQYIHRYTDSLINLLKKSKFHFMMYSGQMLVMAKKK